jgi:hypothetical protein
MMTDKTTRQRAIEILSDPHAREKDWLGALAILDGKLPVIGQPNKTLRYARRVAGMTLLYTTLFYSTSLVDQLFFHQYAPYTIGSILPLAFVWAVLETSMGFFTIYAAIMLAAYYWTSLLTLNPMMHTIWMIIFLNLMVYFKFRWTPYAFVPVGKLLQRERCTALTRSCSS